MPPPAYVAFCERKPHDCGDDVGEVLLAAQQADADRLALLADLGPSASPSVAPASLGDGPATTRAETSAAEPPPSALTVDTGLLPVITNVTFVPPIGQLPEPVEDGPPRMTPRLWSLLNHVNGQLNSAIREESDLANYGVEDYWNTPLEDGRRAGDCEDYVLEKERALIAAGVPRSALNIAVVLTHWGEDHAVLLVATSDGEFVLDNLSPWIVPWRSAPYRWLRRQVNGEAFNWVMVPSHPQRSSEPRLLLASSR